MEDSLLFARLTLMLLRASVPHPESLPARYGILIPPSTEGLSEDQTLAKLEQLRGEFQLRAEVQSHNLVIFVSAHTEDEATKIRIVAESFSEGIRHLARERGSNAQVRAVGFHESLLVPAEVIQRWFWLRSCSSCYIGIGAPISEDAASVAAVVYLGC